MAETSTSAISTEEVEKLKSEATSPNQFNVTDCNQEGKAKPEILQSSCFFVE